MPDVKDLRDRSAPLEMDPDQFREAGHNLIDQLADFLARLRELPVTPGESSAQVRQVMGASDSLPEGGADAAQLLGQTARLLLDHSLFNGHPRFWGYITSSAAPIGVLGELLAAAVNPNVGAWKLAPLATEMEAQTVRWVAELIGYPTSCGGLLVSGGNLANFICFLVARTARAGWNVRKVGLRHEAGHNLRVYASDETHTWIQKATDLSGLGTDSIRWISTDEKQRVDLTVLRRKIQEDLDRGDRPFLVVGTAGSVSTGAIDPLPELAALCREHELWFHVDGAYGAFASLLPDDFPELSGLSEADSIALDPHKWLYAPLEAGCVMVRDPEDLGDTFSYHPPYYHFDKGAINYFDLGLQNSRGFRALKVWLALRHVGRTGYARMIADDIHLARELERRVQDHPDLEALTQSLSITTFRYVPSDLVSQCGSRKVETYLNQLNQEVLTRMETGGKAFLSNALLDGKFALRTCIVNFRTSLEDIEALPEIVTSLGRQLDETLRPQELH